MRAMAKLDTTPLRRSGPVIQSTGMQRPLCRLVCIPCEPELRWTWETCDHETASGMSFTSLYECAENARQNGFEVDLLRAPLVTGSRAC